MKIAPSVRLGAWLLIGFNLLMALGSIWIFMRMAPAIEIIIERNERSLEACEEMMASLAMISRNTRTDAMLKATFENALKRAQNNITEKEEPAVLATIQADFADAFLGDRTALQKNRVRHCLVGENQSGGHDCGRPPRAAVRHRRRLGRGVHGRECFLCGNALQAKNSKESGSAPG